jgi:hypothetical protein
MKLILDYIIFLFVLFVFLFPSKDLKYFMNGKIGKLLSIIIICVIYYQSKLSGVILGTLMIYCICLNNNYLNYYINTPQLQEGLVDLTNTDKAQQANPSVPILEPELSSIPPPKKSCSMHSCTDGTIRRPTGVDEYGCQTFECIIKCMVPQPCNNNSELFNIKKGTKSTCPEYECRENTNHDDVSNDEEDVSNDEEDVSNKEKKTSVKDIDIDINTNKSATLDFNTEKLKYYNDCKCNVKNVAAIYNGNLSDCINDLKSTDKKNCPYIDDNNIDLTVDADDNVNNYRINSNVNQEFTSSNMIKDNSTVNIIDYDTRNLLTDKANIKQRSKCYRRQILGMNSNFNNYANIIDDNSDINDNLYINNNPGINDNSDLNINSYEFPK